MSAARPTLGALPDSDRPAASAEAAAWCDSLLEQIAACHRRGRLHGAIDVRRIHPDASGRPQIEAAGDAVVRIETSTVWPDELRRLGLRELPVSLEAARAELRSHAVDLAPEQIDWMALGEAVCRLLTGEGREGYLKSPRVKVALPRAWQSFVARLWGCDGATTFASIDEIQPAVRALQVSSILATTAEFTAERSAQDTASSIGAPPVDDDTSAGGQKGRTTGDASEVPPSLGNYRIIGRLGQGGMGDVYEGYDPALDRHVAIKVLPAELARHEEFVRRFRAEATAAARLVHPHVVQVFFIGEDQGRHYFAMQHVEGESLSDRLHREGRLAVAEAVAIIEDCLQGLSAAHQLGLIHRDIKPGNILLDRQRRSALLSDFGLVKTLGSTADGRTTTGVVMGTADYIAPEQGRGQPVDARSDLYSVGVMLYRMLSGKLPFAAETPTAMIFQHVYETPPPLAVEAPHVPPPLAALVHRLLAKFPDDRFQSAAEVLAALRDQTRGIPAGEAHCGAADGRTALLETTPLAEPAYREFSEPAGWFDLLLRRASRTAQRVAPELVQQWQTTGQQMDDALQLHAERLDELERLSVEAERVAADLRRQAAGSTDRASEPSERYQALVQEHDEQLAELHSRRDKARATLQMLRAQRDALQARLQAAQAQMAASGGPRAAARSPRRRLAPRALAGALAAAVLLCVAWGLLADRGAAPPPGAAPAEPPALTVAVAADPVEVPPPTPAVSETPPAPEEPAVEVADQRAVAEWVQSIGGTLIGEAGKVPITVGQPLPAGDLTIREIDLQNRPQVANADLSRLRGLPGLTRLSLYGNPQLDDAALAPLAGLVTLQQLNLTNTRVTDAGLQYLAGLRNLAGLNLAYTRVTGSGLAHLVGLKQLTDLNLADTPLENDQARHLKNFPGLLRLELRTPSFDDVGIQGVASLRLLRQLTIARSHVTGAGLRHLRGLEQLEVLHLWQARIDDDSLQHLAGMKFLKSLNLSETAVTGAGLKHLDAPLTELNLWRSPVDDAGVKAILRFASLEQLTLDRSTASDEALLELGALKKLRLLQLQERPIRRTTLDALQSQLPQATISVTPTQIDAPPPETARVDGASPTGPRPEPRNPFDLSRLSLPMAPSGRSRDPSLVILTTRDPPDARQLLGRELVRQAILLAAREELGAATRDESLGETFPQDPDGASPLEVLTSVHADGRVYITIFRLQGDGYAALWEQHVDFGETIEKVPDWPDRLAPALEQFSRNELVAVLKAAGVVGTANRILPHAEVPQDVEDLIRYLTCESQFAALRRVHHLMRSAGESAERLSAAARAYAHLGVLAEPLWSTTHKALKARALLYAERLAARTPESPHALWTRAYVRALVGRIAAAQADLQQAQELAASQDEQAPSWVPLISAYCQCDRAPLLNAADAGEHQGLASLLLVLTHAGIHDALTLAADAARLQQHVPDSQRAIEAALANSSNEVQLAQARPALSRFLTEWPQMCRRLDGLPEMSQEKLQAAQEQVEAGNVLPGAPADFAAELRRAGASDRGEPSLSFAAHLLDESAFLRVWAVLKLDHVLLGVPTEATIAELRPLFRNHPLAEFFESCVQSPVARRPHLAKLAETLRPAVVDWTAARALSAVGEVDPQRTAWNAVWLRMDKTLYQDLMLLARDGPPGEYRQELARQFRRVAPDMRGTIGYSLRDDWTSSESRAVEWEQRYSRDVFVLSSLAGGYRHANRSDDAIRCLKLEIEAAPGLRPYRALAQIYYEQKKLDQWQAALDQALAKPAGGLEHAQIQFEIARHFMDRGRFQQAEPYAEGAAKSYSHWGLVCGADCQEGLENWDASEKYMRAMAQRYQYGAFEWFLWCIRTGHGNRAAAERAAGLIVAELRGEPRYENEQNEAAFLELTGQTAEALEAFSRMVEKYHIGWHALESALLADELGDVQRRDRLLSQAAGFKNTSQDRTAESFAQVARMFIDDLKSTTPGSLDVDAILKQIDSAPLIHKPWLAYLPGRYLKLRGRNAESQRLLQHAATDPQRGNYGVFFARHELHRQKIKIAPMRYKTGD